MRYLVCKIAIATFSILVAFAVMLTIAVVRINGPTSLAFASNGRYAGRANRVQRHAH